MHLVFLDLAYDLAEDAVNNGNHPFGALLEWDGQVLLKSTNEAITQRDATRHAEMNLLHQVAQAQLPPDVLARSTLYSSTEPCVMCSAAIFWAGITRVVFGCRNHELMRVSKEGIDRACADILSSSTRKIEVIGPIAEEKFLEQHRRFWTPPQ